MFGLARRIVNGLACLFVSSSVWSTAAASRVDELGPLKVAMVYAGPSLSAPEAFLGHTFVVFYRGLVPSFGSEVFAYLADTGAAERDLRYLYKGIVGDFPAKIHRTSFFNTFFEYSIRGQRPLMFFELILAEKNVEELYRTLLTTSFDLGGYGFFTNNCAHGASFMLSLAALEGPESRVVTTPLSIVSRYSESIRRSWVIAPAVSELNSNESPQSERAKSAALAFYTGVERPSDLSEVNRTREASLPMSFREMKSAVPRESSVKVGAQNGIPKLKAAFFSSDSLDFPYVVGGFYRLDVAGFEAFVAPSSPVHLESIDIAELRSFSPPLPGYFASSWMLSSRLIAKDSGLELQTRGAIGRGVYIRRGISVFAEVEAPFFGVVLDGALVSAKGIFRPTAYTAVILGVAYHLDGKIEWPNIQVSTRMDAALRLFFSLTPLMRGAYCGLELKF